MRVARGLLITIACLSLIGTVIPQQEEPAVYLARFGPSRSRWLTRLGLTDLYHSWCFASLLLLLGTSLTVCSVRRWAVNLKTLGSVAMHVGFVLVLAGGIVRHVAGIEGVVELREGDQITHLKLDETHSQTLPFAIQLEDFFLQRYSDNPGVVSEFVSRIRLVEANANTEAAVRVNHPIVHRGFRIYQLGYNPDDPTWTALLVVNDPGIPMVYTGFSLVLLGLLTRLYVAPWLAGRGAR